MFLVTGANGQLGIELRKLLGDKAVYVDKSELDISDESAVQNFLTQNRFECIINCAAYTAVDKAEDEELQADAVNRLGPMWLAKYGKCIIHISTDYVFDGTHYKPYTEEDKTGPVSVYGRTKLAGEQAVLSYAETAIIIRTAWLFSSFGNNFLKTMLRLGKERNVVSVVADQIGSPTFAGDLANAILGILPVIEKGKKSVYHFTNEGICSWYDFASAIMEISGYSCRVIPIESKNYPTKAVRPFYSVLNKNKIKRDFGFEIPYWRDALVRVLENMKEDVR